MEFPTRINNVREEDVLLLGGYVAVMPSRPSHEVSFLPQSYLFKPFFASFQKELLTEDFEEDYRAGNAGI